MIAECSQISIRKPQTVFKVINGEDGMRYGEASFKADEKAERADLWYEWTFLEKLCVLQYDNFTLEQNKEYFEEKHKGDSTEDFKSRGDGDPSGELG